MKLDIVHDLQSVYRKIVDASARPGQLSELTKEACIVKEEGNHECPASILLLALTLFDQEVTFKVISEKEAAITKIINQLTYAKPVETEDADYILILQDAGVGTLATAIEKAKPGTLKNPHSSATIIVEVSKMSNEPMLQLKGPGIHTVEFVHVETTEKWVESRQMKNKEYPLGIELMFVDHQDQLLSLPRTTQITENRVIV
ncbi:phosphonate C-P lyase system protein PhnH [Robertmurraya yapensis]|uniref:Phosphonate C-P lyase system protein PhnH n=2 Tax=Bacillaceae TaxID=186817 RepID=A0A431W0W1_9BACI|nr:phosphonate C-P lyase system protein PhnH [Bacillus yapensis]RTR29140.1 phosphonate C-P lyase system protein PhnH [Bacillus yapensis]TKS94745.1 phosphonate C-P lyase system protein PhnH [Bacillus yapensis]